MKYIIIKSIDELKDGDIYQKSYPMVKDLWSDDMKYDSNICKSRMNDLIHLINNKRIRKITNGR